MTNFYGKQPLIYMPRKKKIKGSSGGDEVNTVVLYKPYVFGNSSYISGVEMLIACDDLAPMNWYGMSTLDGNPLMGKRTFTNPADNYSEIYMLRFSLNPSSSSQFVNSVKAKLTNVYFIGYNFDSTRYSRSIRYLYFIDNTNHIAYKLEQSTQHSSGIIYFNTDTVSMTYSTYSKAVGRLTVSQVNSALDNLDAALQAEDLGFGYMYMSNVPISNAQLTDELGCTTIQILSY